MSVEEMLASLRALEDLPEDAAKSAAPLLGQAIASTVRAATSPDGTPWVPTADGHAPLVHAVAHLEIKSIKEIVRVTLTGHSVFHHFGGGKNKRRPVLPDPGTIPPALGKVLDRVEAAEFRKTIG